MTSIRIRPRSSIADPALARAAVVDLPAAPVRPRLHKPLALLGAMASFRRAAVEPERVIVLTLNPMPVRQR